MREVRLIGEEGEQLGVVPTFEALRIAEERGLDLVEVAPTAIPPVCRLMDYGRFKYEQTKKEREAKKNQKVVELKEVRMTPRTDEHDILAKAKTIQKFLEDGDKVKVTIRFRGRELAHPQLGRQVLEQITANLQNAAALERPPLMEGKAMSMVLSPPGAKASPPPMARPAGVPVGAPAPGPRPAAPAGQGSVHRPPVPAGGPPPRSADGAHRPPASAPTGPRPGSQAVPARPGFQR